MKIYISADIEGISGVVDGSGTSPESHNYQRARKLMTDEVCAAVSGAKRAGASEILINDSHGPMTNILIEDLDEDVRLISGSKKRMGMMEGLDNTYDAVLLIGYHSRHNTSGVLAHSYYGRVVTDIRVNGQAVGEFEFNTMVAEAQGVPVIFVSGDDVLAQQVKDYGSAIEMLVVKEACGRYSANCIHPVLVRKYINERVFESLHHLNNRQKPLGIQGEVLLEMSFMNSGMAEATMLLPNVEQFAGNKVQIKCADILEAYRMRAVLTTLAGSTL